MPFEHPLFEVLIKNGLEIGLTHRASFKAFLALSTVYRKSKVRVSFASMLRLQRNEKYLLVESRRRHGIYGPLGGVVRYFASARPLVLDKIGFENQLPAVDGSCDLRGYIRGSHFHNLMMWYVSGRHIERLTLARELEEELKEIQIKLPKSNLPRLEFDLVRVVHEGPHRVPGEEYLQYRCFSVCDLQVDDPTSRDFENYLVRIADQSKELLWASRSEIRKGRARSGAYIGDHSGYLFGQTREGISSPPF
jgi:hypothetical protein